MTDMDMPLPEPEGTVQAYECAPPGAGSAMFPVGTLRPSGQRKSGQYTADQIHARDAKWRAIVAAEVAKERKRCAKVCDGVMADRKYAHLAQEWEGARLCAAAIRAAGSGP